MTIRSLALALALGAPQEPDVTPSLLLGEAVEAEVDDAAVEVHTPLLSGYREAPTVGVELRFVAPETGPVHIDLRSYDFDAYLVLRTAQGELLAEDDDGLLGSHARIVAELEAGVEYRVSACALHGARGAFQSRVVAGLPAELAPRERARLELEDAREALAHVEARRGPAHLSTATCLQTLADLQRSSGALADARALMERALAIREAELGPDHLHVAVTLSNMSMLVEAMGDYEQAQALCERALVIYEAQYEPDHPALLSSLFGLGKSLWRKGDFERAQPVWERALEIAETAYGPNHLETAMPVTGLATLLRSMGKYDEALPLFERALAIREEQLGRNHLDTAESAQNLATLLVSIGDYGRALLLSERSLAIYERQLGPDHPVTAGSLHNLAYLLYRSADYGRALPLYERAIAIREKQLGSDHPELASLLGDMGGVLFFMGDYARAKPLFERALAIREQALGPTHFLTGQTLNYLGMLNQDMGDLPAARVQFERSLAICETHLGPVHPATGAALNNLALLLYKMGDYGPAQPLFERALAVCEATVGPDHADTAASLDNLAYLLGALGDHDAARVRHERALEIRIAQLGRDHPLSATSMESLALALRSMGELDQALVLFEGALAVREARLGFDHDDSASVRNNLATLLLDMGATERAWELIRRGQAATRDNMTAILAARTRAESTRYLATMRWQQELLLTMPRILAGAQVASAAATGLISWKGQVGRAARRLRRLARESDEARSLSERLRAQHEELSKLAYDAAARQGQREQLMLEVGELEVQLRDLVGVDALDALDVDALRAHVPVGAALLSFFVQRNYVPARLDDGEVVAPGNWSTPHLVAWVVRSEAAVASVDLGPAQALEERVRDFLGGIAPARADVADGSRGEKIVASGPDRNAALRSLLWDPLVEHLGDASLVVVSNDSFTATVPFEALMGADGRYLVEGHSFVYLHDLQALGGFGQRASASYDRLFCVGGVDFDGRGESKRVAGASLRGEIDAPTERWQSWPALAATSAEVETIRDLHEAFVPHGSRTVLTGIDASEERVLAELPRATLVHLATHGYFQPEGLASLSRAAALERERMGTGVPGAMPATEADLAGYLPEVLSGLVLAGANLEREQGRADGHLTAADVDWLDLSGVELVTLSACETGLGRSESGEGMSGFRTTLLRAGAKTVVSSLWQIPDDATEELMSRFYENLLRRKLGKLEALREAQLWMLAENRRKHGGDGRPHTWAAFVLSGDWR